MMETVNKQRRGIGIVALIGFLVTAAAIIVVPLLVVKPENRGGLFAPRIVWMEFLAVLLWGAIGGFFLLFAPADKNRRGAGGVYPSFGIITVFYVAISSAFMLIQWLIPASVFLAAAQIPVQIILLVLYIVLGVILFFALAGARGGTKRMPEGVPTPAELDAMLRTEEERLKQSEESGSLCEAIKALREKVHYSLPQAGRIADSSAYAAFTGDVRTLYNELSALDLTKAESVAKFGELASRADSLRVRIDAIVENLKRT